MAISVSDKITVAGKSIPSDPLGLGEAAFNHQADAVSYAAMWNTKKSQTYERKMANKFLPFIVETSKPLHIFKTILSRSKGMNRTLIASVFYLVLTRPLKTIRDQVKEFPDMSLEKIYEELLVKYPECRLDSKDIQIFTTLPKWFPSPENRSNDLWIDDLNKFEEKDIMLFMLGICSTEKDYSEYTNIPFGALAYPNPVLENIPKYVDFADRGEKVYFESKTELLSFVLYQALLAGAVDPDAPKKVFCAAFKDGAEL